MKRGPQVPPVVAVLVIVLACGGVVGYYYHFFRAKSRPSSRPSAAPVQKALAPAGNEKGFSPTFEQAVTYLWRTERDHRSTCSDFQVEQFLSVFKMMRSPDEKAGPRGYQETTVVTILTDSQIEAMREMFAEKDGGAPAGEDAGKEPPTDAMLDDLIQWFEARGEDPDDA